MRGQRLLGLSPFLALLAMPLACCQRAGAEPRAGVLAAPPAMPLSLVPVESIYDSGLGPSWHDYGWAPRQLGRGPARIDFSSHGGWIVAHPGLKGRFGGLLFRIKAPPEHGEFLEVRVDTSAAHVFPRVKVGAKHAVAVDDGWSEIFVPISELDPDQSSFDRVVFRAWRHVGGEPVLLERVALTAGNGHPVSSAFAAALSIDCRAPAWRISPGIYGIAFDARLDASDHHQWLLGATGRRWGGNPASRYNWELGNAWNTASDWFFRNVDYSGKPGFTWASFLDDDLAHDVQTALTVPMLGWVARDRESVGFPVSAFGRQRRVDPYHPEAGDGFSPEGEPLAPGPPARTSVALSAADVGRWVAAIREHDRRRGARSVHSYILDNEPALWSSTHRDVHPEPVTYDELLERTIAYAAAVREADPEATIAGPAEWGWPAWFYSAADAAAGFRSHPDRKAHGEVPLLAWYLRQLHEYERASGESLLDVVDVHFYPQGKGLQHGTGGDTDADTNARRIRATRSLWDPTYVDESWIGESIRLIPRLREWIAQEYPGRKISIGEWSFGAEEHPSGGLALAEALGRFGQQGVDSAYYWTYPAKDSFAFQAFRAFRNFDERGGRFLDYALPTRASPGTSLFASRDAAGRRLVVVALNFDPAHSAQAAVDVSSCGPLLRRRVFAMGDEQPVLAEQRTVSGEAGTLQQELAPYSVNVFDIELASPLPAVE